MNYLLSRHLPVLFLLGATLVVSRWRVNDAPEVLARPLEETIPKTLGAWTGEDVPFAGATLAVLKPTSYVSRIYRNDSHDLGFLVIYYAHQRAGESFHSPKICLPGSGWEIWKFGSDYVPVNGTPVRVNRYSIQKGASRMLMLYWYQSRNRISASEYLNKLFLIHDAILRGTKSGSIVRITVSDTPSGAREARWFASQVIPQVQASLGH